MGNGSRISIVGTNTKLSGTVESDDVMIIAGFVKGDVHSRKVVIKAKGRVDGNIVCQSLVIEPGGIFDGRASMSVKPAGESLGPEPTV